LTKRVGLHYNILRQKYCIKRKRGECLKHMNRLIRYMEDGIWKYASVKDVGDLNSLLTTDKTNVVSAINELKNNGSAQGVQISDLDSRAISLRADVNQAVLDLVDKADLTYVDGELVKKIDLTKYQTEYDAVNTKLADKVDLTKHQQDYNLITTELNDKVSQLDFAGLEGRVSTTETEVTDIQGELSTRITQTEFDDAVGVNQWIASKYDATGTDLSTTYPSFPLIKGKTALQIESINDSQNLVAFSDENIITHYFTNVKLETAKTVELSVKYEDSLAVYMNGAMIYENGYTGIEPVSISLSLRAGWNTIEILHGNYTGIPILDLGLTMSSQVDKLTTTIGVGDKNETRLMQAETEIKQTKESITLKADKTVVTDLGNRIANSEASIQVLNDSIATKVEQTDFNAYTQRMTDAESSIIQNANSISQKVNVTDYNLLNDKVTSQGTEITQLQDDILLKVDSTTHNSLESRVASAETQVNLNKEAILLKASQTDLDTVTGRISDAEAQIIVQADEISQRVTKTEFAGLETDVTGLAGRMSTAETNITQTSNEIALKADKSTTYTMTDVDGKVSALNTKIADANTAITQNAENINLKASSTDVYTKLEANDLLGAKANQTDLSALVTRVSTAETEIDQTSEQILLKASKTELEQGIDSAKDYVQSRTENLITNGTGLLGDNTNFSGFTFDGSQAYAGAGSFYTDAQNYTKTSDELIPVDPSQKYRATFLAKSALGVGHNYAGFIPFDIDKNVINSYSRIASNFPVVELTQDLKVGDTIIHLSSLDGFQDTQGDNTHWHSILMWGYKNNYGYEYPAGTYSRHYFGYGWLNGAIDTVNKTITLSKPFDVTNPSDPQGIFRAGHKLSRTHSGSGYLYTMASNIAYPTEWTRYEGILDGVGDATGLGTGKFPYGTAFMKLMFLTNRNTSGGTAGDSFWINGLEFYSITQEDNAKNYADTTVSDAKAEIKITTDGISQSVSEVKSTVDGHTSTLSSHSSSIQNLSDSISLKVSSTEAQDIVDNSIDNLKIGGGNILKNSGNFDSFENWQVNGVASLDTVEEDGYKVISATGSIRMVEEPKIKPNTTYILSAEMKFTSAVEVGDISPLHYHVLQADGTTTASKTVELISDTSIPAGEWGRIAIKFDMGSNAQLFRVFIYDSSAVNGINDGTNPYFIKNVQLEEGNKLTDWSPSPYELGNDMSSLLVRVSEAEQKISDDSIINTVTSSETFNNTLSNYAQADALKDYVTDDSLGKTLDIRDSDLLVSVDGKIAQIDLESFDKFSTLKQTTDGIVGDFGATGGVNLLKNSIGFGGFQTYALVQEYVDDQDKDWYAPTTDRYSIITGDGAMKNLGFISGFQFFDTGADSKYIYQDVPVIKGESYTLSWYIENKAQYTTTFDSRIYMQLLDESGTALSWTETDRDGNVITHGCSVRYDNPTEGYFKDSVTYVSNYTGVMRVRIYAYGRSNAKITGIMLNKGKTPLQWTMAHGEIYNTNVQMDNNGIQVNQKVNGEVTGVTVMTPKKFAGYYDVDESGHVDIQDNSPDEVFRMDKEEFVMKKARIKEELTMGSIIVKQINSTNYNGWAFLPVDEE
jgi:hypothetical protein